MKNTTENEYIVNILDLKHNGYLLASWVMTNTEIEKFNNDNRGYLLAVVAERQTYKKNKKNFKKVLTIGQVNDIM